MIVDWRELYETEYPRLVRALTAMGGDPDAAEDAAQEAFVRAHKHGLERLERLERPGAWLLVVGTRELFRRRLRRRREQERWDAAGAPAPAASPDAAVQHVDLLAALRRLPERQRAFVVARFFYDLTYDEIARAFSVKSGTVGATLHQAVANLRELYAAGRLARGAMR